MFNVPSPFAALLAFFVVCVAAVWLLSGRRPRSHAFQPTDYRAKPLLSRWELKALAEIKLDLPAGYHACPQVRLADLLEMAESDPSRRRSVLNRVAFKSVDFAIIDHAGAVVLVIELDDRSHARPERRARDHMVDAVLAHCRLPLLRVRPGQPVGAGRHLAQLKRAA